MPTMLAPTTGHSRCLSCQLPSEVAVQESVRSILKVCVAETGTVWMTAVISSGGEGADRASTFIAGSWRFEPLSKDGVATPFCYPAMLVFSEGRVRIGKGPPN